MVRGISVLVLIFSLNLQVKAAKILCVFQLPILSHQIAFRSLTDELLRRNHQIDVITADPSYPKGQTPPNMTEIDIHDMTYDLFRRKIKEVDNTMIDQIKTVTDAVKDVFKNQFASKEFQDVIKRRNSYKLVIADISFITIALSHIFKAPLVTISTAGSIPNICEYFGIPRHALFYPNILTCNRHNTFLYEKYKVIYNDFELFNLIFGNEKNLYEELKQDVFPELLIPPILWEQNNNMHMYLVNMYPIWEGIRPYPPNSGVFKFVTRVKQEIPEEFQSYLESSKNGVIYASFGTSVSFSLLPKNSIDSILKVYSLLPYDIFLKCDKDELPGRPKNVRLFKFLPQPDVLRHPKIKLFITQGGQHSIDEAIEAGVPMVVIPARFDQFPNSENIVLHKIGIKIDLKAIDEHKFLEAIKTVIEDKSYRENIVNLRFLLQDSPMKSMDRLMWSIEYLLRHGGTKHMRSPSADLTWAEFFELELLFYFFSVIAVSLYILITLLLYVKRFIV